MKKEITLDDIPENEVRMYMFVQEFDITKKFITALLIFSAVGFLLDRETGIAWAIIIVSLFKFLIIPLVTHIGLSYSKRNDTEEYIDLIETQKRKYHKKQYLE